jgi:hypothetical protein
MKEVTSAKAAWKTLYSLVRSSDEWVNIHLGPTDNARDGFTLITDRPVCFAPTFKGLKAAINEVDAYNEEASQ